MAIFRAGKRIGPFDIRGGISRGDYKSSAYHKTDRDPRFKMKANTDNTIGRFRAAINQAEGFARQSRFAIRIFPPSNIQDIRKEQNSVVNRAGEATESGAYTGGGQVKVPYSSGTINNLTNTIGRQINIMCDSVIMPGHDLMTQSVQYGSEPTREQVTGHTFDGNIVATFYSDKYLRERQFFELWQKAAVNTTTHKANYYSKYTGKMHIYQLGSDTEVNRDMPTYALEAIEVYPSKIGAIDYSYGASNSIVKTTIEFAYKQWFNMGIESTRGLEFGEAMQTPAMIKQRDPGIFGKLPPDLKRAGKNIFQQGRTVWNPIGRIFNGKVFPPFT